MPVLYFMEYDIPRDEQKNKDYLHFIFDEGYSCNLMDLCERVGAKLDVWVDDSGHLILTIESETAEGFARLSEEPEWKKWVEGQSRLEQLVSNVKTRMMHPAGA